MTVPPIRAALPGDATMLARLHAQCFEQAWDERAFSAFLSDAVTFALLAGAQGQEQAFIVVRAVAGESEILSLGTQTVSRRSGLARALVHAARAEAHRRGARRMFLEVAADNEAALALYGGAGFTPVGRRRHYYTRAIDRAADAVILSAELPGFS
jgi:[ribosomal protein S18]-alanine N-acetyltransferase